jgi:hypothetical protein
MILTLFIFGCLVTLIGAVQFDGQQVALAKLSSIPVILIGFSMMVCAIAWSAP